MHPEISEAERFPLLSPAGRQFLHALRQDRHAPQWNWPNGEQLDAAGLESVQRFAAELRRQPVFGPDHPPEWLRAFVDYCLEDVPYYRRRFAPGTPFTSLSSFSRADLTPRVWEFVPDSQALDRLIVFSSSGTTGHPAQIPSHPATAACGIPLLEHAPAPAGVRFARGVDTMALTNVVAYRGAYTTAIVMAYLHEAGCIRVNLCDEDWHAEGDCRAYLDHWHADVMLGDPLAFMALDRIPLARPPRVMVSTVMALSDRLAEELAARYGCAVVDLYSLTEAGLVAKRNSHGHEILPHDVYVEILDEQDRPCAPGVRGEITITGGRNPFLPLLRYRTGDFAALAWPQGRPVLVELAGRQPVAFSTSRGAIVHSMEVTRCLRPFPLSQFRLYQDGTGIFHFGYRGAMDAAPLRAALANLLGADEPLEIEELPPDATPQRKVVQYQSDFRTPLARTLGTY